MNTIFSRIPFSLGKVSQRGLQTLASNRQIKAFPDAHGYLLSFLATHPPTERLSLGRTTSLPPTPATFQENKAFSPILNEVIQRHGHLDPSLINYARSFAGGPGGYIHLSDSRRPPDFGRIAAPEDILGSVEVDGQGSIIGKVEPSGTYRLVTNDGILGLSPYLEEKLIQHLQEKETNGTS